ncbi:hypothetical protein M758_1G195100 [Ceratodon purpureus]|nr:hypothetical protein M758_1G195100 [Ceratodon purpureus]
MQFMLLISLTSSTSNCCCYLEFSSVQTRHGKISICTAESDEVRTERAPKKGKLDESGYREVFHISWQ